MNFKMLLLRAQDGEPYAVGQIFKMYKPLIFKEAVIDGIYDEDLFQEFCLLLFRCIHRFSA